MKVLAICGSPRGEGSCTARMLRPLVEGMKEAGAEADIVFLSKHDIKHCTGCFTCWGKTPGKCVHNDDVAPLLEKFIHADMIVFGSPLYHFHVSGIMKDFIDRTLPIYEPWLIEDPHRPGLSSHPGRYTKPTSMFLVSPCGFPEFEHFDPLLNWFKDYAKIMGWKYMGEILRPAGEVLNKEQLQGFLKGYFANVREAGKELIRDGAISDKVSKKLRGDLFPGGAKYFRETANKHWKKLRNE
ncbi:flavodoxin family protein [Candidatus Auribacterota bacterium]